jgi:hypothetical protein
VLALSERLLAALEKDKGQSYQQLDGQPHTRKELLRSPK